MTQIDGDSDRDIFFFFSCPYATFVESKGLLSRDSNRIIEEVSGVLGELTVTAAQRPPRLFCQFIRQDSRETPRCLRKENVRLKSEKSERASHQAR